MNKNNNRGLFKRIQDFLISYDGKTLLNFLYSWGAAVVILGALFKLTHLPGANMMLYIGMGTEVLVFLISAFDRPAKTYRWESVFPDLEVVGKEKKATLEADEYPDEEFQTEENIEQSQSSPAAGMPFGTEISGTTSANEGASFVYIGGGKAASTAMPDNPSAKPHTEGEIPVSNEVGTTILGSGFIGSGIAATPTLPLEEMEEATKAYLDKLKEMTETITRLNEQMESFTCDPDQMQGVNRHIAGLNAIFELQLRSASKQVESVDKVHEQTEKMAAQIEELNKVYARMLQAMTANMINQQSVNQ